MDNLLIDLHSEGITPLNRNNPPSQLYTVLDSTRVTATTIVPLIRLHHNLVVLHLPRLSSLIHHIRSLNLFLLLLINSTLLLLHRILHMNFISTVVASSPSMPTTVTLAWPTMPLPRFSGV